MSRYTGLSCSLSRLVLKYGSENVFELLLEEALTSNSEGESSYKLSDAFSYLASAVISDEVKRIECDAISIREKLSDKKVACDKLRDSLLEVFSSILSYELDFSGFLEPRFTFFYSAERFPIPRQPIKIVKYKVDQCVGSDVSRLESGSVFGFVLDEAPQYIKEQIDLYMFYSTYNSEKKAVNPLRYDGLGLPEQRVKPGSLYKLLELRGNYRKARDALSLLYKEIDRYHESENELRELWDVLDSYGVAIERCIPDELGCVIGSEKIICFEEKVKSA